METLIMSEIFPTLVSLLCGILTAAGGYAIVYLNKKKEALEAQMKTDVEKKYAEMITDTITDCVNATTQTFVEKLKAQNKFDKKAQEEAFQKTFDAVKAILTEDLIEYIHSITNDLDVYLTTKIEATVKEEQKCQ